MRAHFKERAVLPNGLSKWLQLVDRAVHEAEAPKNSFTSEV